MHQSISLPVIEEVTLKNFTLYNAKNSVVSMRMTKGVSCLVGANGIGKSTFLTAINYALTGIVASADQKFDSAEEYFKNSLKFIDPYFDGRIKQNDRDLAAVELTFSLGGNTYKIQRGIFDPVLELREFEISNGRSSIYSGKGLSSSGRQKEYAKRLVKDVGLKQFDQFVFLQHFVFTFDERRHLLFWDDKALELALFLVFGVDKSMAAQADRMRRDIEKASSRARNFQFQARQVKKRMDDIQQNPTYNIDSPNEYHEILESHRAISELIKGTKEELERIEMNLRDAHLQLAGKNARLSVCRNTYNQVFQSRVKKKSHVLVHPLISDSIAQHRCGLCGQDDDSFEETVKRKINTSSCPLCDKTLVKQTSGDDDIQVLKDIDQEIQRLTSESEELYDRVRRLEKDEEEVVGRISQLTTQIKDIEKSDSRILDFLAIRSHGEPLEKLVIRFKEEIAVWQQKRDEAREEEKSLQSKRKVLENRLEKSYNEARKDFIPMFIDLAKLFLGIDLDIQMDKSTSGWKLVVEVDETARFGHHQLSESQKFFIDIALRMALIKYVAKIGGCLYLDTPEGSLDIAYENQAGLMLGRFVKAKYHMIMTANINASGLLQKMAKECGDKNMAVHLMLDWVHLSTVQQDNLPLFTTAYKKIKSALSNA